jgi:hypothetical protein
MTDMTESTTVSLPSPDQPKAWWRPLAIAIATEARAGRPCTLPAIADLIEAIMPDVAEPYLVPRAAFAAAVRAAAGRRGGRRCSLPNRNHGALARAVWRHLEFALGGNASIGGLLSAQWEATPAEFDVAEDFATVLAHLMGGSRGVAAWSQALGLQS